MKSSVLVDARATELVEELRGRHRSSVELTRACLARIEELDSQLHSIIAIDPGALDEAARRDSERERSGLLHGLPVLLKDNIDAVGTPTTAGSLALAEHRPTRDAFLVARLRQAGAVVLGKANLSEWANFRSTVSSSGWSAVGGQVRNPHVLDRSPCGSSSGSAVAVAAGLVPVAVGTETDGSILCPAAMNGIVGVKPTLGLVSRRGIVPIAHSQDTAGPMARTVADAALLLEVLAAIDPDDLATTTRPADLDTAFLNQLRDDALSGARLGVLAPEGIEARTVALYEAALRDLQRAGAVLVPIEPVEPGRAEAAQDAELEVLLHEFSGDLAAYLTGVAGVSALEDLMAFNQVNADVELRWFGQEMFERAAAHPRDEAAYEAARALARDTFGRDFVDARVLEHGLQAIVAPTGGPAWPIDPLLGDRHTGDTTHLTAVPGYPAVTVPMGMVEGLPVGLSFLGRAWADGSVLSLAHAYEQATAHRVAPAFRATLSEE